MSPLAKWVPPAMQSYDSDDVGRRPDLSDA
jgi:hypothetical protein